jgi:hypothetical protein
MVEDGYQLVPFPNAIQDVAFCPRLQALDLRKSPARAQ